MIYLKITINREKSLRNKFWGGQVWLTAIIYSQNFPDFKVLLLIETFVKYKSEI